MELGRSERDTRMCNSKQTSSSWNVRRDPTSERPVSQSSTGWEQVQQIVSAPLELCSRTELGPLSIS